MTEEERSAILKSALILVVLEGWTAPVNIRARLGTDVADALGWLWQNRYIEVSEHDGVRWLAQHDFESLWGRLVPDRRCPLKLCGGAPRGSQVQKLR